MARCAGDAGWRASTGSLPGWRGITCPPMLEPRIYRTGLVALALALLVCAFSLRDPSGPLATPLVPDVFDAPSAYATMSTLAHVGARRPGRRGDGEIANYVAARLRRYGFAVSASGFDAASAAGARTTENVTGTLAGSSTSTIAIVAPRDASGAPGAAPSGTAVLLELARALGNQTERHTIVVASVSGSAGAAGAARLARSLSGPVDAVLVLGDMASTRVRQPVILPWSRGPALAPGVLRATVAAALSDQARLASDGVGVASQVMHQAFAVSSSAQAPFNDAGEPAVLISRSSEQRPDATAPDGAPTAQETIGAMGRAVLQSVDALDQAPDLPRPSAYLTLGNKELGAGPMRLLVLALIAPVALALLDAGARVRRRRLLRWRRHIGTAAGMLRGSDAQSGVVAALAVLCGAALVIWALNPLAALMLVPALHLWIWLAADVRWPYGLRLGVWLLGLAVPAVAVVFYADSAHLDVAGVLRNGVQMIAGGQLGPVAVALWSAACACAAAVLGLARRVAPTPRPVPALGAARAPLGHAGPRTLGASRSALRR